MLSLSQNIAQLEAQVEKVTREKISAINQLEEVQNQLASKEMDVTKVQSEILVPNFFLMYKAQKAVWSGELLLFKIVKIHIMVMKPAFIYWQALWWVLQRQKMN